MASAGDADGDGIPDLYDLDDDGDGLTDEDTDATGDANAVSLAGFELVHSMVVQPATLDLRCSGYDPEALDYAALKAAYRAAGGKGAWMVNNGYDLAMADQAVQDGADLVAFGKAYIANPDLVRRLREGAPLNTPDKATFYGGGAKGYTDYPTLKTA